MPHAPSPHRPVHPPHRPGRVRAALTLVLLAALLALAAVSGAPLDVERLVGGPGAGELQPPGAGGYGPGTAPDAGEPGAGAPGGEPGASAPGDTATPGTELCLAVLMGGSSPCLHGEGSYADHLVIRPSAGDHFPASMQAPPPLSDAVVRA